MNNFNQLPLELVTKISKSRSTMDNFDQLPLELVMKIISFVPDLYYFYSLNLIQQSWYQIISKGYSKILIYQKCKEYDMNLIILHYHHFVDFILEKYEIFSKQYAKSLGFEENAIENMEVILMDFMINDRKNIDFPLRLLIKKKFIGFVKH